MIMGTGKNAGISHFVISLSYTCVTTDIPEICKPSALPKSTYRWVYLPFPCEELPSVSKTLRTNNSKH